MKLSTQLNFFAVKLKLVSIQLAEVEDSFDVSDEVGTMSVEVHDMQSSSDSILRRANLNIGKLVLDIYPDRWLRNV